MDQTQIEAFGAADPKVEGAFIVYGAHFRPRPPRSRLSEATEWPRRKLARGLERLADWICRDRDEGW